MKTEKQIGAKPIGIIGILAGKLMNTFHKKQYYKIVVEIKKTTMTKVNKILDIGCGGGIAIKEFSRIFPEAIIFGIDHSEEMVKLSSRNNTRKLKEDKIVIQNNSVENISIKSNTIDIVTAFDTISFWDNHKKAIEEIKRVLKIKGVFYIINGYPKIGTKWYDIVKFKNDNEYKQFLTNNGFSVIDIAIQKKTIIIKSEVVK